MNPDDMYLQTFLCVCVYIYKKEQAFFFPLSIHGILLGPTAAPPERGGESQEDGGKSSLSLSLQLLRLFLAALSAMHAAFLTSLSLSHPPAFSVSVSVSAIRRKEDMGILIDSQLSFVFVLMSHACPERKE